MAKSTVTSKGQTTVPRGVRELLAVGPGDTLDWMVDGNTVRVSVAGRAFLARRGAIRVGRGSVVADVRSARRLRGSEPA